MAASEKIIKAILGYVQEDGRFPEIIIRRIEELKIKPQQIFQAYLENPFAKEPTEYLVKNSKDIILDSNAWELFLYRIRKNPNVSEQLMDMFYHKDKNFYNLIMEKMISLLDENELFQEEKSNLIYFLEENKIWI